jgi:signal transduction histidine kinase
MFEPIRWLQERLIGMPSFILRLTLCILSFLFITIFYVFSWHIFHSSVIWCLPMALSAWYFKRVGAGICFLASFILILLFTSDQLWSTSAIVFQVHDVIVIGVAAILVCWLRKIFDVGYAARQQGTHALQVAFEQQNKLNLLKQQFLLNVNHELRTPLTAMYSCIEYLHMVLEQQGELTHKEHAAYLQDALHSCEELRIMVNQVTTIMELECDARPQQTESISVKKILTELLDQVPAFKQQRDRTQINRVQPLILTANATYLRHILYHLLSNALKYAPPDTPIVITCEPYGNQQEQVCISIQDAGPGIPKEEIPRIFEDFVRLQRDVAGVIRGPGLGLSISKRLVEMMQGQIWAESSGIPGQGSCFRFVLPRAMSPISIITKILPESQIYTNTKEHVYA